MYSFSHLYLRNDFYINYILVDYMQKQNKMQNDIFNGL